MRLLLFNILHHLKGDSSMQLTILVDNTTSQHRLKGEAGLSIYLEDRDAKVLFDTGESSLFLENASQLGINLQRLTHVILSHGHHDHSWGVKYLLPQHFTTTPILLAHPIAFSRRIKNNQEIGINITEQTLANCFSIHKSKHLVWITDRLVFLGEINRKFMFEGTNTIGQIIKNNIAEPDFMQDDTALAFKSSQGLVIITGCSHSGICNIIEQAKQLCHDNRILAVIGGLHLRKPSAEQLDSTIAYLKQAKIKKIYACHCTDQSSRIALAQIGNLHEAAVGLTLEF
jgi:7,8-dihydropterin-6-yl-methyl-4-(beta-D-ribofuranosyl)aminobenzene 5'-phosphate synthase